MREGIVIAINILSPHLAGCNHACEKTIGEVTGLVKISSSIRVQSHDNHHAI